MFFCSLFFRMLCPYCLKQYLVGGRVAKLELSLCVAVLLCQVLQFPSVLFAVQQQ